MKWMIGVVSAILVLAMCLPASAASLPEEILASMSTQDKIAQLLIPAYRKVENGTTDDVSTLCGEVAALMARYPFAGIILYGENLAENDAGALLVHQLQRANASDDARPQLLIMTDQEGGLVARMGHSTSGVSMMAMGATGQTLHTQKLARMLGEETRSLGINVDLAPVADIPTDPHTDPVGLRAFGDTPELVTAHARAYLSGLRQAGILGCIKHFPGIGSASKPSDHTTPLNVDRSRAQLADWELQPYKQVLAEGLAEIVMLAHASYPQLESRTFIGSDGQTYTLPASLSPQIATTLLRQHLGFTGLAMTDSILGSVMADHFQLIEVLRLALEAGVDVLSCAVELNDPTSVTALQETLATFAAQVETNASLQAKLDATVLRILNFKAAHGLLTPYARSDAQAQADAEATLQTVSSQANHDEQWQVALEAITLVSHSGDVLPLSADQKVSVLYYYASQEKSVAYALDRLVASGQMTAAQMDNVHVLDVHADELTDQLTSSDVVVILSSVYYESELSPDSPSPYSDEIKVVPDLITQLRALGKKVIVASCHLPYEIGLYYDKVDAILACYLANGISTPIATEDNQPRFGAMVPALVYKLYDRERDFQGKLPVNIPVIADGAYEPDKVLLPHGWGLTLTNPDDPKPGTSSGGCSALSSWWLLVLVSTLLTQLWRH